MIDYTIVRSDRKTISIAVRNAKVTIRAPKNSTDEDVAAYVKKNEVWVTRHVDRQSGRLHFFDEYFDLKKFMYLGESFDAEFGDFEDFSFEDGKLRIPNKYRANLKEHVKAMYKRKAAEYLPAKLKEVSEKLGIEYKEFRLGDTTSRWGSCTKDKKIILCWRLMFLPQKSFNYVLAHELCHTKFLNHSREFWSEVQRYVRFWYLSQFELKHFSALSKLYQ